MSEKVKDKKRKSLRIVSPDLYNYFVDVFEARHNIHSYDMQLEAVEAEDGLHVHLQYGDQFAHAEEYVVTFEAIKQKDETLKAFVEEAADNCQKVMVADYFKMMKP